MPRFGFDGNRVPPQIQLIPVEELTDSELQETAERIHITSINDTSRKLLQARQLFHTVAWSGAIEGTVGRLRQARANPDEQTFIIEETIHSEVDGSYDSGPVGTATIVDNQTLWAPRAPLRARRTRNHILGKKVPTPSSYVNAWMGVDGLTENGAHYKVAMEAVYGQLRERTAGSWTLEAFTPFDNAQVDEAVSLFRHYGTIGLVAAGYEKQSEFDRYDDLDLHHRPPFRLLYVSHEESS